MNWLSATVRVVLLVAVAAAVGWYFGAPLAATTVVLFCLVLFWLFQLYRVQHWMKDPTLAPPDIYGIWGDLLVQIYLHHRRSNDEQQSLRATVEYLQDSFASMRDGVVTIDPRGAIGWFNKAAEPLFGLSYPDDQGQALSNRVRESAFSEYLAAGDYTQPLQYVRQGRQPRHLRVEVTRFGADERLLFVRDVTQNVRMEQIRRDFVGNVSHELRTPLTVITGYLDTFLDAGDVLPAPYRKGLKQMAQQSARMENLLRDLLWLSRIESDIREGKQEVVDMASLITGLREEFADTYPGRLEVAIETRHQVMGDSRELYSAVSNLVGNALKYSPEGSVVSIRWYQRDGEYHLAVSDRGIGIDPIHIPRLTERFFRVDESRSSTTGGTGLGLAIVKHVAAAHGARLVIRSKPGQGSTFSLVFAST